MEANNQEGRNMFKEVEEIRERLNKMEETLKGIQEFLNLLMTGARTHASIGFNSGINSTLVQKDKKEEVWIEKIEKETKAIQGTCAYESLGVEELFSPMDVVIPKDFVIPNFAKYNGNTNPLHHLKTYCTKMAIWSKDERFLVGFFHESLTGPALEWYIQLDHSKLSCWKDLADVFMNQYRFNLDIAPTREQLGTLQIEKDETFKQYAQRWRTLAAQVRPPLILLEMCSYFIGTLGSLHVELMAGVVYQDSADLIAVGERIEILAKARKLSIESTTDPTDESLE